MILARFDNVPMRDSVEIARTICKLLKVVRNSQDTTVRLKHDAVELLIASHSNCMDALTQGEESQACIEHAPCLNTCVGFSRRVAKGRESLLQKRYRNSSIWLSCGVWVSGEKCIAGPVWRAEAVAETGVDEQK